MYLKAATTACLALALILCVLWVQEIAHHPVRTDSVATRREFADRLTMINGGIMLALVGAGVGAVFIVKQAREDYRDEMLRNRDEMLREMKAQLDGRENRDRF